MSPSGSDAGESDNADAFEAEGGRPFGTNHARDSAGPASSTGRGGGAAGPNPRHQRAGRSTASGHFPGSHGSRSGFRGWDPEEAVLGPPPESRLLRPGQLLCEAPLRSGAFDAAFRRHVAREGDAMRADAVVPEARCAPPTPHHPLCDAVVSLLCDAVGDAFAALLRSSSVMSSAAA